MVEERVFLRTFLGLRGKRVRVGLVARSIDLVIAGKEKDGNRDEKRFV